MSVFSSSVFDDSVFAVDAAPVAETVTQGVLLRKMRAVPYRGPKTGARVISPAAIRAARRRFRQREDDWLLGFITDDEYREVA